MKKNVFAQTAEILGFLVDFPAGIVQPKKGAIAKMFFVLRRMRPFIAQINAMSSKATQYQTAHATPSALFEIEIWRAAVIMVLMSPPPTAYVHQ